METDSANDIGASQDDGFLDAVASGNVETARQRLSQDCAVLNSRLLSTGETPLHIAVKNGHLPLVRLLLLEGAEREATTNSGEKPLYLAAGLGSEDVIDLLLASHCDVESWNAKSQLSALHRAVECGQVPSVELLLKNGAALESRNGAKRTPLQVAIGFRERQMVESLLRHGADKNLRDGDGRTVADLAQGSSEILALLETAPLLQGPVIQMPPNTTPTPAGPVLAPNGNTAKMLACHGFQATVVDFFLGSSEQRIEMTASVYDLLYGQGPHGLSNNHPDIRWYHLPANNIEWVEHLVRRCITEGNSEMSLLSEAFISKLGLSQTQDHRRQATPTPLSFKRAACHSVKMDPDGSTSEAAPSASHIFSVIPYLHFETESSFQSMTRTLKEAFRGPPQSTSPKVHAPPGATHHEPDILETNSQPKASDSPETSGNGNDATGDLRLHNHLRDAEAECSRTQQQRSTDVEPPVQTQQDGKNPRPEETSLNIYQKLVSGYIKPSCLQPRRTLDQYFYTQLDNTYRRDKDQVVLRYTSEAAGLEPKLIMVDQLWIWIINGDTVISSFPTIWPSTPDDAGSQDGTKGVPSNASIRRHQLYQARRGKVRRRRRSEVLPPQNVETPRPTTAGPQPDSLDIHQSILAHLRVSRRSPITSACELARVITSFCVDVFDPHLVSEDFQFFDFFERSIGNVREECAKQLQRFRPIRPAATFAELDDHSESVAPRVHGKDETDDALNIEIETRRFVEIEDILDELGILQMVLDEQGDVLVQMDEAFKTVSAKESAAVEQSPLAKNRVLEGQLRRLKKMDAMAARTSELLYHLIDLKQKQASILEALSARRQTDLIASYAKQEANEAKETAQQGRTVLLFTVVTIVFLPLSFMAAFFAINIDIFPVNENGKLDLGYVLKYMISISAGLSIPFIFVIFNQERVWRWLGYLRVFTLGMPLSVWVMLLLTSVLLIVIWTTHLSTTVRVALTIPLILMGVASIFLFWIWRLVSLARRSISIISASEPDGPASGSTIDSGNGEDEGGRRTRVKKFIRRMLDKYL